MKSVVITGSARGFGYCQAKKFRELGFDVCLSDINEEGLKKAVEQLKSEVSSDKQVIGVKCNVTVYEDLCTLWNTAKEAFGGIGIWVNNAGVNSPDKPVYELTEKEISFILDVDLKGTVLGSKVAFAGMKEQGYGQIYNVEGYGSNDAVMTGLTMYGTSKRAVTYFTKSLAQESRDLTDGAVKVCRLTPGIMITEFIKTANGGATKIELPEKTKKVYNILGDYPETIVDYCVPRMAANTKNDANIVWLTSMRAAKRFMFASFNKRDFFAE